MSHPHQATKVQRTPVVTMNPNPQYWEGVRLVGGGANLKQAQLSDQSTGLLIDKWLEYPASLS